MRPFTYERPADLPTALRLHASRRDVAYLAGGTTLVDLMRQGVMRPTLVVDINGLPELRQIESHEDGLRVGALVSNSALARHPTVASRYPVLAQALLAGASPQLRNMATVGGNLLQRTRCPYFRDTAAPCNKRTPGSGCSAFAGINRGHAVLGGSSACIATHPSDMAVAMLVLSARISVAGLGGRRVIPIADFHRAPGTTPDVENVLLPGEMIVAVEIPPMPTGARSGYLKVRDRSSYEFALSSAAALVSVEGNVIRTARLALGGVATKPWLVPAQAELGGKVPSPELFRAVADRALSEAKPKPLNAFKVELAKRTIVRILSDLTAMA